MDGFWLIELLFYVMAILLSHAHNKQDTQKILTLRDIDVLATRPSNQVLAKVLLTRVRILLTDRRVVAFLESSALAFSLSLDI